MKRRTAIAMKLFASLLFLSDRARALENYETVLYTEKRSGKAASYVLPRGETLRMRLTTAFDHSLHHCRYWLHCWQHVIAFA